MLATARLRIADLAVEHAAVLFEELRAPGLYVYIDEAPPASLEALTARFARLVSGGKDGERWRNWVMFDQDQPVGTLQATIYDDGRALIAYAVLPRFWRRGYAAEGVTWMLEAVRAEHGVERADALIDTRNVASIRLVESLGFHRVETVVASAGEDHRYAKRLTTGA